MENLYEVIENKLEKLSYDYNCSQNTKSKNLPKLLNKWEDESKKAVAYIKLNCFCKDTYLWQLKIAPNYREAFFLAMEMCAKNEKDILIILIISNRHPEKLLDSIKKASLSLLAEVLQELVETNKKSCNRDKPYDKEIANCINARPEVLFSLHAYFIDKLNLHVNNAMFFKHVDESNFFNYLNSSSRIKNFSLLIDENLNLRTAFYACSRIQQGWEVLTKIDAKLAKNFDEAFVVFIDAPDKWRKDLVNLKWLLNFVENSQQSISLTNYFVSYGPGSFQFNVSVIIRKKMIKKELAEGVSPEKLFKQNYSTSNLKISDLNEEIIEKFLS